jgi:hypothetical protein
LRLWDALHAKLGTAGTARVHPVTIKLLALGPFRRCLELLVAGKPLADMPILANFVLPWRFLSLLERSIEAKHAMAKKNLLQNTAPSPASVSLALRMREIHDVMCSSRFVGGNARSVVSSARSPSPLDLLAEDFGPMKDMLVIVGKLGLASHPLLVDKLLALGNFA